MKLFTIWIMLLVSTICMSQTIDSIETYVQVKHNYTIKKIMVRLPGELKFVKFKKHKKIKQILKTNKNTEYMYKKVKQYNILSIVVPLGINTLCVFAISQEDKIESILSPLIKGGILACMIGTPINYLTYKEKSNIQLLKIIKQYNNTAKITN